MCYAPPLCDWGKAKAGIAGEYSTYYINNSASINHIRNEANDFSFSVAGDNTHNFKIYGIPF